MGLNLKEVIIGWIDQNLWFVGAVMLGAFVLYAVLRIIGVIKGGGRVSGGYSGDGVYHNSPGAAYRNAPPTTKATSSTISTNRM